MYRLNVQVTAYRRLTIPNMDVLSHVSDPLIIFGALSYHWNGRT